MHPAYSVIVFTTASGAGLGLLLWLAAFALLDLIPAARWLGFAGFAFAFALLTGGLLSSTLHLGRPERAWRAFSQWRSSWLSREGVAAVATYVPAGLLAIGWVLGETTGGFFAPMALLTVVCALGTLYTTGMIYASLPTIRQWHQPLTAPLYIVLGLASGAVLLNLLLSLFGHDRKPATWIAIIAISVATGLKWLYWLAIDGEARTYTAESATGLGRLGKVRPLEPPHTQPNFVMREMGYRVARKHAERLRKLALLLAFAVPVAGLLLSTLPRVGVLGTLIATLSMAAGLMVERWLFFAEAEHVAMLYYGAEAA
jgi:DMSO reductase anchor subunit